MRTHLFWRGMVYTALLSLCIFSSSSLRSQSSPTLSNDTILSRIQKQSIIFPQEKIHVHTDKSYYLSGEKIWLRAYLVNTLTHRSDSSSLFVYGELINPFDSIVSRIKILHRDNAYAGHMQLQEELPAGNYNIRFYTQYMQNIGEDYFFNKKITIGTPQNLKFKAEIISAQHEKDKATLEITFTDVESGERVKPTEITVADNKQQFAEKGTPLAKKLKLNKDQSATYKIDLSKNKSNHFYIEYNINGFVYSEFLPIPTLNDDFHLDFFPEGGHLVAGANNIVAFKSISKNGYSTDVHGYLCSNEGDTITDIKSDHLGMGFFLLFGDTTKEYYVDCENERGIKKRFTIPLAESNRIALSLRQIKDNVHISINSVAEIPEGLRLLLHTRGIVINLTSWKTKSKSLTFKKDQIPEGVIHCLLIDNNGIPISERLFFNFNEGSLPTINQINNKSKYKQRELVTSEFNINDSDGIPVNGSFSISVTDNKDIRIDSTQNMLTSLLLTSELKGHIENPSYYFQGSTVSNHALDLLMQTQEWRRYNIPEAIRNNYNQPSTKLEYLHSISGRVKGGLFLNKKSKESPVFLVDLKTGLSTMTTTDNEGNFSFDGIFPDSLNLMIIASNGKGKSRYDLEVDQQTFPKIYNNFIPIQRDKNPIFEDYLRKADMKYTLENGMRVVHLKSVEVTAKLKETEETRSSFSSLFSTKIDLETYQNSRLTETLQRIGGAEVVNSSDGTKKVYFRGNRYSSMGEGASAVILVDDIENHFILEIDPFVSDFESLEIHKGAFAMLGSRGSGGAVIIMTKRGGGNFSSPPPPNIASIKPLGFQHYVEFYSPKYQNDEEDTKPDLRSTIYWNPNVKIIDGRAKIQYYTSDNADSYSVFIDGLTNDGEPLHIINQMGN